MNGIFAVVTTSMALRSDGINHACFSPAAAVPVLSTLSSAIVGTVVSHCARCNPDENKAAADIVHHKQNLTRCEVLVRLEETRSFSAPND